MFDKQRVVLKKSNDNQRFYLQLRRNGAYIQFVAQEFAEKLKNWRKEKGLVQKQAADVLQVSLRTYQGWECGSHEPLAMAMVELERRMSLYAANP